MLNTPFSPWPSFTQEEADAVSSVLLSNRVNYWTGQECHEFEKEFADWCGTKKAIALSNGTAALDLALLGIGVGTRNGGCAENEVIVPPRTFLATASSVATAGAIPVFADVDWNTGNISAETIAPVISENTKAIIVVHLGGTPCEMDPILELARQHGLKVIEDCAQAHGASYKGRPVGSIGDVAAWSFCQDKIMSTGGEGGMVTTQSEAIWSIMWSYKDHGKSWESVYEREHPLGFRWLHDSFGTNFRMTEIQAAIGRIQLRRMTHWQNKRNQNAACLTNTLAAFSGDRGAVRLPKLAPQDSINAFYKYYTFVQRQNLAAAWNRDRIVQEIVKLGVPCYQGTCSEVYLEKAFDQTGWRPKHRLPVAKELGETSLMFLVHPTLTETEMALTTHAIEKVLSAATG